MIVKKEMPVFLNSSCNKVRAKIVSNCAGRPTLIRLGFAFLLLLCQSVAAQDTTTFFELAHRLPTTARVLMTGAHPDDENNALLTYLSRGLFVHCAYLSATRGEGGQNLIGPELFDALGIIRTEELLAARRYDHCDQFFTRAYDFGFSKDPNEAFAKWGREEILGDIVRVIRRYRPDIVISMWRGTSEDGHGHHQAVGLLTPEAFRAAADPSRFPEHLKQGLHPWQAKRFYVLGRDAQEPKSFSEDVGQFSLPLGKSLTEVAAIGRSQHQSQGEGSPQIKGPWLVRLKRLEAPSAAEPTNTTPPAPASPRAVDPVAREDFERILQDRISSWADLAGDELKRVPFLPAELSSLDSLAQTVAHSAQEQMASTSIPDLTKGIQQLRALQQKLLASGLSGEHQFNLVERLGSKEHDFSQALIAALGLSFEARASEPMVDPRGVLGITATLLNRSSARVEPISIEPEWLGDWTVKKTSGEPKPLGYNESIQWQFAASVAADTSPTEMYWLQLPREGDRYKVGNPALTGRDENFPELSFVATFRLKDDPSSTTFRMVRPVEFVHMDPRYGEQRESVKVVPTISVSTLPVHLIVPRSATAKSKSVFVRIENESSGKIDGTVKLMLPRGWTSIPISVAFSMSMKGETVTKKFVVRVPPNADRGDQSILAIANVGKQNYSRGFQGVSYPHIHAQNFYRPAQTLVHVLDLKLPAALKVGYIMGSGDRVPEALEQMGVRVTPLDAQSLAIGTLSGFDAIVTGIRAYDVRPDLAQNNARLLDYVKKGGTLIVQYNSTSFGINPSRVKPPAMNSVQGVVQAASLAAMEKDLEQIAGAQPEEKLLPWVDSSKQFGPYPLLRGLLTDRVVDEGAPVRMLVPTNPVFTSPNLITEKDFDGWVQERGLYFMKSWDSRYTPLLASHDPGEQDQPGGMLFTRFGKGIYVLTGYAWFRQLPAGVPGAYRIFANLISQSHRSRGR